MMGLIVNREVDLAAGAFALTHERAQVVDYTTPFLEHSVGILTPAAGESTQIFQFLKPFSLSVWITIVVFILTTAASLWMMTFVGYRHQRERDLTSPLEYWMLAISCLCGQGPAFYPSSLSARCLLGFWLLFSVLVVAVYTGHQAAVLTVKTPTIPINSLQGLANNEDFTILVPFGSSTWTVFEDTENEIYQKINSRKVEAIELVEAGNAVYIAGRGLLLFHAGRTCGKTRLADEKFSSGSYGFVLPKDSPHLEAFNINIASLVESGLVKVWENKWLNPTYNCSHSDLDKKSKEVSLETMRGMFIAYGIIVILSFMVVLIELLTEAEFRRLKSTTNQIPDMRDSPVTSQLFN